MYETTLKKLEAALLHKNVQAVELSSNLELIRFTFKDGSKKFLYAYGDCCSSSWFETVEDMDFRGEILSIEDPGAPPGYEPPKDNEADMVYYEVYFLTIKTNKGRLFIEMRNSSNGYYGGDFDVWDMMDGEDKVIWKTICGENEHGTVGI